MGLSRSEAARTKFRELAQTAADQLSDATLDLFAKALKEAITQERERCEIKGVYVRFEDHLREGA
jgi:hypothetical protein